MIAASAGVKVMVATRPVDFRKGADGLAALVREQLRHDRKHTPRPRIFSLTAGVLDVAGPRTTAIVSAATRYARRVRRVAGVRR